MNTITTNLGAPAEDATHHSPSRATAWLLYEQVALQAVRIGSHITLAWFLVPDVFGIVGLSQAVCFTALMVFDLGITTSVVYHPDGENPRFLGTAWLLQAMMGFLGTTVILAAAAIIHLSGGLAGFAADSAWGATDLLPVVAAQSVIILLVGLRSPSAAVLRRRLQLGPLAHINVIASIASVVITLAWVLITPTLWAMVAGQISYCAIECVLTYRLVPQSQVTIQWDRKIARDLFVFGRWCMASSSITAVANKGDQFFLASILTTRELGIYTIALKVIVLIMNPVERWSSHVLIPVFVRFRRNVAEAPSRLKLLKLRILILGALVAGFLGLVLIAPFMVQLVYNDQFHDVAWLVQCLGVSGFLIAAGLTKERILLSTGDSKRNMISTLARAVCMFTGMAVGYHFGGYPGLVIGLAFAPLPWLVILLALVDRYCSWPSWVDMAAIMIFGVALALGLFIMNG
ncbi:MAG: oligosaccharide flippase family protein [Phycisphaera sp.]|nr:oligosaccharide flippase family protein [Phycisphaera sp.]